MCNGSPLSLREINLSRCSGEEGIFSDRGLPVGAGGVQTDGGPVS